MTSILLCGLQNLSCTFYKICFLISLHTFVSCSLVVHLCYFEMLLFAHETYFNELELVFCTRHIKFLSDFNKHSFRNWMFIIGFQYAVLKNSKLSFLNFTFSKNIRINEISEIKQKKVNVKFQVWHLSIVTLKLFVSMIFDSVALHVKDCTFHCNCRLWICFISSAMLQKFATMAKILYLTFLSWNESVTLELEPILGI